MPYLEGNNAGFKARETSESAANAIAPKAGSIKEKVLRVYHGSPFPLTADEVAEALGLEFISVRPRVTELGNDNRLKDSGIRRKGRFGREQIAWELA